MGKEDIISCIQLRRKYVHSKPPIIGTGPCQVGQSFSLSKLFIDPFDKEYIAQSVIFKDGICQPCDENQNCIFHNTKYTFPTLEEFFHDLDLLNSYINISTVYSYSESRLNMLDLKFQLHQQKKYGDELAELACISHRDFYNIPKVDTHIHHSACMNGKHLLKFIKYKLKYHSDDVVLYEKLATGPNEITKETNVDISDAFAYEVLKYKSESSKFADISLQSQNHEHKIYSSNSSDTLRSLSIYDKFRNMDYADDSDDIYNNASSDLTPTHKSNKILSSHISKGSSISETVSELVKHLSTSEKEQILMELQSGEQCRTSPDLIKKCIKDRTNTPNNFKNVSWNKNKKIFLSCPSENDTGLLYLTRDESLYKNDTVLRGFKSLKSVPLITDETPDYMNERLVHQENVDEHSEPKYKVKHRRGFFLEKEKSPIGSSKAIPMLKSAASFTFSKNNFDTESNTGLKDLETQKNQKISFHGKNTNYSQSALQKSRIICIIAPPTAGSKEIWVGPDGIRRRPITLAEIARKHDISPWTLSLNKLSVLADRRLFNRFDRFNEKYSPCGVGDLRHVFLKSNNDRGGQYLAELTTQIFQDLTRDKYVYTEYRISIYGRCVSEWDKMALWMERYNLYCNQNRWMIQFPRMYGVHKSLGHIKSFGDMIYNIFYPIFYATLNHGQNPTLDRLLLEISGFDTVDDESKSPSTKISIQCRSTVPIDYCDDEDPTYSYYSYYIAANIHYLNLLRKSKGLNTYSFRPHAGESGPLENLQCAFLLADSINHGINLRHSASLQYLYYLMRIGLAMSPVCNNHIFLGYTSNPFGQFYSKGMNVSLSTDDPLVFHYTRDPLMEEYSIAREMWKLSSVDLCELARNSILQSGFPLDLKYTWLGSKDENVNCLSITSVSDTRFEFRRIVFETEWQLLLSEESSEEVIFSPKIDYILTPQEKNTV